MVEIRLVGKYDEVLIAKQKLMQLFPPVSESVIVHNEVGKGYKSYINVVVPSSFENLGMYDKQFYGLYDLNTGVSIDDENMPRGIDVEDYDRDYQSIVNAVSQPDLKDQLKFADFDDVDGV